MYNYSEIGLTFDPKSIMYKLTLVFLSDQVDVYSFGVLLCEMCNRVIPYPEQLHYQILEVYSGAMQGLIRRCVLVDPKERLSMSDVICGLDYLGNTNLERSMVE